MTSAGIDVELTVTHDVKAVACVACLNDDLARRDRNREEAGGNLFLRCDRKRCEERHAIDELELWSGSDRSVYLGELSVGEKCEERQNRPDEYESRTGS